MTTPPSACTEAVSPRTTDWSTVPTSVVESPVEPAAAFFRRGARFFAFAMRQSIPRCNQPAGSLHPMSMLNRLLATAAVAMALVATTGAQRNSRYDVVEESTDTRTLSFAAGGGRALDVRNITGFI